MGERLLPRAILAFVALPGVVAFLVPLVLIGHEFPLSQLTIDGVVVLVAGVVTLFWCIRDFHVAGRGTLASWDPPRNLVTVGLYRFSRNPMYIGVLLIVTGWALGFRSPAHGLYALLLAVVFHLRVVLHEEPYLERTHGPAWPAYRDKVPRWLIR